MIERALRWTGLAPKPPKIGSREALWTVFAFLSCTTTGVLVAGWWQPDYLVAPLTFLAPLWLGWFTMLAYLYQLKDAKVSSDDFMAAMAAKSDDYPRDIAPPETPGDWPAGLSEPVPFDATGQR